LVGADLPYRSYEDPAQALAHARRLIAAGAQAVKAEGGRTILDQVKAIVADAIPFIGHLGMLPQHVLEEGGYRIKGTRNAEREALLADARALEQAGAFAVVLELVVPRVAQEISQALSIPTIGIGSGPHCDGQILVTHDLLGTFPWFTPKFVRPRLQAASEFRGAVHEWMASVREGKGGA
jgi:3-methyl-2-oxobutanoate hydroxymethyltransferase